LSDRNSVHAESSKVIVGFCRFSPFVEQAMPCSRGAPSFIPDPPMNPIEFYETQCPWCASPLVIEVDSSAGDQRYVEDCGVCCQPIAVRVSLGGIGEPSLFVECTAED
jgi:hypothetical protein